MTDRNYQRKRDAMARKSREQSAEGRDLGEIPPVKNPKRRKKCERNLALYLSTYYPGTFPWEWSDDHRKQIARMEAGILDGGLYALAAPRGDGKSSKILRACNWALSYGHRRFIAMIAAEQSKGEEDLLDPLKIEWETNDLLLEDFPEIAYPIRALEGIVTRARAQTINGRRTFMTWKGRTLVFPTVPGSSASGATVRVTGLLGRIRGMSTTTASGDTIRPDLVMIDDPQTDESARSDAQCAVREKILNSAVLGLAGPGKRINGFAAVTVIREGDVAHRLLNRKLYPRWQGEKYRLVYEWPKNKDLVEKYKQLRLSDIDAGDDTAKKATAFWKKNRKKIEEGARVGWEHRKTPDEVSAVQHAVNLQQDNPDTFDAEYQNEPKQTVAVAELRLPTSDDVVMQRSGYERGTVPEGCNWIGCGWDVQGEVLFWSVVAVDENFSGWVIDYGAWPQSNRDYFTLSEVDPTISAVTGIADPDAALRAALSALTDEMLEREYVGTDGSVRRIDRMLCDAGWRTKTVYAWARQATAPLWPCHGRGVTAKESPWETMRRKRGERVGYGFRMPPVTKTDAPRHVLIDTNTWKTQILPRFCLPLDSPGAWALFKSPPVRHRMFGDHLSAERPTKTSGRGRTLFEFSLVPGRENHWLDATLYAAVAAVIAGAPVPGVKQGKMIASRNSDETKGKATSEKAARKSLAELREEAIARRRKKAG